MWRWLARGKDHDELIQPGDGRQGQIASARVRVAAGERSACPRDDLLDDASVATSWQDTYAVANSHGIVIAHGDALRLAASAPTRPIFDLFT